MKKNILGFGILTVLVLLLVMNILKTEKASEIVLPSTTHTANEIEAAETEVSSESKYAQDFTLTTLQGEQVSLSDYKGKIVILNFWTSWCGPCKEEMPHMQSFSEKHPDIQMLAVNLTSMDLGLDAVKQFVEEYRLTFPILLDEADAVGKAYNILTIPTSYIIDREGRVFKEVIGPMDETMMEELISDLKSYD